MNLSAAEQALVEEMVAARSVDLPKPPWMQSHRTMRVHKEARVASPRSPRPPTSALHSQAPLAFDNAEHKRGSDEAWGFWPISRPRPSTT
jgi:hypothetical protein